MGISGQEGMQAVMSSDFAIAQVLALPIICVCSLDYLTWWWTLACVRQVNHVQPVLDL